MEYKYIRNGSELRTLNPESEIEEAAETYRTRNWEIRQEDGGKRMLGFCKETNTVFAEAIFCNIRWEYRTRY